MKNRPPNCWSQLKTKLQKLSSRFFNFELSSVWLIENWYLIFSSGSAHHNTQKYHQCEIVNIHTCMNLQDLQALSLTATAISHIVLQWSSSSMAYKRCETLNDQIPLWTVLHLTQQPSTFFGTVKWVLISFHQMNQITLTVALTKAQTVSWGAIHERRSHVRRRKPFTIDIARAIRLIHETRRKICNQSHVRLSMRHRI